MKNWRKNMSKQYLVEVTMTGEQWIEADSEAEAIEKAKDDPFYVLQYTGDVTYTNVWDVREEEE